MFRSLGSRWQIGLLLLAPLALAGGLYLAERHLGPYGSPAPAPVPAAGGAGTALDYPREAVDAEGNALSLAAPTRRIVSRYWSIDDFAYSVAPPETVVGVSDNAYERRVSNVYAWAERFNPVVASNPEVVLQVQPDLVLTASGGPDDFANVLDRAGLAVFRLDTMFATLDGVAETILLTGFLTGNDAPARAVHENFLAAVERAGARKPPDAPAPRILGFGGRYSYGDGTLFHDIVRAVGGINVGAENGLRGYDAVSLEQILRWDPDWIVTSADPGAAEAALQRMMEDPAIGMTSAAKKGQILVFEHHVFLPMSPFTTLLLDALSEALYGPDAGA